ncbi:MAG: NAD+ synthase [Pseudomonadota bacterium]
MSGGWRIALAQVDPLVGDVEGNLERVREAVLRGRDSGARLVVLPEMVLAGYPPEDLLFHSGLRRRIDRALAALPELADGVGFVVGFPEYDGDKIWNAAAVFDGGREVARYRKWLLPNYAVFDEKRYFETGDAPCTFEIEGTTVGLTVCEDVWQPGPAAASAAAGAELILTINGSPYAVGAQARREGVVADRVRETGVPLVYVNMVGGQDELVFDGGSFAMAPDGETRVRGPAFEESIVSVNVQRDADGRIDIAAGDVAPLQEPCESVYAALVQGTRDYVRKNGFPGVILGLSGGIDSALTLAVAVDALAADAVRAVMMPYRYTADMSREDAALQAAAMGVDYDVVSIEPMVEAAMGQLAPLFGDLARDTTEENIQSRCRCIVLMALSNKTGRMLLTTGNKSEMAVGYATLYGDMAGGYAPIKDCPKTLVYELARFRNSLTPEVPPIPERVITRPPSAELAPDQKDEDSLPPYEVLDPILEAFMERDLSVAEIAALGFDRDTVVEVLTMVRRNEYKRRQAPPGVRISSRAFGRDWRYPITSGYRFPAGD